MQLQVSSAALALNGATLPLKVVVTSGVTRIWCQGGTTIEVLKAPSGVGMGRVVRSSAD